MIVPGVIGAIGLVVSLVSLHKLDVATGGLALLFLGIAFMIGEAFLPSFGFLGIGGVISFFLGSVFLFDPSESEHSIPMSLIFSTTLVLGACTLVVAYMAFNSRKARRRGNFNDIEGSSGEVMKVGVNQKEGSMQIEGEIWKFKSEDPVQVGDQVMVTSHKGLTLFVKKGSQ